MMSISIKTHKMLWGRSGNRCAMPDCKIELVMDISETDDESLIGEECHIVAQKFKGPRGDVNFDEDKLDTYNNLLLLCRNHHKIIDDNPNVYTIERLKEIKNNHIDWVKNQLNGFDAQKQKDDEFYASYIDEWVNLAHLNNWKAWSSYVLGADEPRMLMDVYKDLDTLKEWLFSRLWTGRYPEVENSFENFRLILQDFINTFTKHAEKSSDMYFTQKFYTLKWHDDKAVYDRLLKQYTHHVFLVEDLMIELTRAANHICNMVRKYIDSSFRLKEGLLILEIGPFMDMSYRQYRVNYSSEELKNKFPYQNLEDFKEARISRDYCRGAGIDETDQRFLDFLNS